MTGGRKIILGLTVAGLLTASLVGLNLTAAQQMPPNPTTQRDRSVATPAPTPPDVIDDDEVLKIDADVVNVLFTAQDKDRRLLTSLKKEDIRVLEDGKPQEISAFYRQTDLPLSIAILIDCSQSQARTLPEEKEAAKAFVEAVIRAEKDEVALLTFTGETTLEQGLTNNLPRLRRAIDRVKFEPVPGSVGGVMINAPPVSGGSSAASATTAMWDAIWVTSDEVLKTAPDQTRRAIILLTDGLNNYGTKKFEEALNEAVRNEITIYTIGIGDYYYNGIDMPTLRRISERTGGRAYFPEDESGLRDAFKQIEVEMRSQYLVAYEPANSAKDGTYRKIEIELANPDLSKQKVKLTHRQGYFARSGTKKK